MSKTKAKILTQARELFNTYGVAVVSQRKIAEEMGISPGNLTYHFPKKDDINEALYYALVEEISRQVEQRKTDAPTLSNLFLLYGDIYDAFHRYRFVFLDFVHFMKSHGQIAEHYQQLQLLRKFQFDQSVELLIFQGLVRPAELDREYDFLYERMQIFSDFFFASREVLSSHHGKANRADFVEGLRQMIYPYLTKLGKGEFVQ
ncbi:MAG: AcrR family transcriptional regulator [Neolewinella sp.]|jgi:AcrR family transcriptional regulator